MENLENKIAKILCAIYKAWKDGLINQRERRILKSKDIFINLFFMKLISYQLTLILFKLLIYKIKVLTF